MYVELFWSEVEDWGYCGVSLYGLSAILIQYCEDENKKRVVAYASRSLTKI